MLPNECSHCNKRQEGVRLWWYLGRGDWICGYCGELWNPKHPKRKAKDAFVDDTKQDLIKFVETIRPEYPTSRWVDTPRKTPQQRKESATESQRKWKAKNPDKVKGYMVERNEQLKGQGSGNRVRSK